MNNFKWIKYHILAKKLYDSEKEEYVRSAISRDYYACYHLSKNYLIKNKKFIDKPKSTNHKLVSQILQKSRNKKEYDIGDILDTFRKLRNKSDYDADKKSSITILKSKKLCQQYSKTIINNLKELEAK